LRNAKVTAQEYEVPSAVCYR